MKQPSTNTPSRTQQSGMGEYKRRQYAVQFSTRNGEVIGCLRFTNKRDAEDTVAMLRLLGYPWVEALSAR